MADKIKCPYCGKYFSSMMRKCPYCGNEHRLGNINIRPLCPVCQCEMTNHSYHGNDIDMCSKCNSIWVDNREFTKLTSERDVYNDDSIPDEYIRQPLQSPTEYHHCPVCNRLMTQKNFKKISGVIIDVCRDHGVWLEAGELERIRCFIANGGLEQVHDHEIMLNRAAIESIDTRLSDVEFMQKLLHHWNLKRWIFS